MTEWTLTATLDAIMTARIYAESKLPTAHGDFRLRCYRDAAGHESLAIMSSYIDVAQPVNMRLHSSCMTSEVFGSLRCDCREQLNLALEYISEYTGLVVYLLQEGRGIGLGDKVRAYALQDYGYDTVEANEIIGFPTDLRNYGAAGDILRDLGVSRVNLLTNNPDKIAFLENAGIAVCERIDASVPPVEENRKYLETKRLKCGHYLM